MSADGVWRRRLPGRSAAPESVTLRERSVFGIEGPGFLREGSVFGGPFGRVSLISSWMPPSTGTPRPLLLRERSVFAAAHGGHHFRFSLRPLPLVNSRGYAQPPPEILPSDLLRRFSETARVWYISPRGGGVNSWSGAHRRFFCARIRASGAALYTTASVYTIYLIFLNFSATGVRKRLFTCAP